MKKYQIKNTFKDNNIARCNRLKIIMLFKSKTFRMTVNKTNKTVCLIILILLSCNNFDTAVHKNSISLINKEIDTFLFQKSHYSDSTRLLQVPGSRIYFPFEIDSSYQKSSFCGNEPRQLFFENEFLNAKIEVLQTTYNCDVKANPLTNEDSVSYKRQFKKQLDKYKKLYDTETQTDFIKSQQITSPNENLWEISGIEFISDIENNSLKLTGLNIDFNSEFTTYTIINIAFIKSCITRELSIDYLKYICFRLN